MIALIIGFISVIIIFLLTYAWWYAQWESEFFKKRGVKSLSTSGIPFLGHMTPAILGKIHYRDVVHRSYFAFPNEKYFGIFEFGNPMIVLRDLDLIKKITIKDFDSFHDHLDFLNWDSDPLFSKNLFSMKGKRWKEMRPALSPAFTSSKMRGMYQFMVECSHQFVEFMSEEWNKGKDENGILEVEIRDPLKRFAGDVIASCAFGYEVDSMREKDNIFYKMALGASHFTSIEILFMLWYSIKAKLFKNVESSVFREDVREFYRKLVTETMADRERKNIVRTDMIHLLMQAKKGKLHMKSDDSTHVTETGFATVDEFNTTESLNTDWSDDELTAQAIIFIVGGFDTSSFLMTFMAYELMLHQDAQKKLQEEIDEVYQNSNGKVSYNDLNKMKYMDMVVSETLRKWSQGYKIDRKCMKEYELPPPNDSTNKNYKLKPGDGVWIPISAIHHDPQYYPNPDKFDPERFSDENKANINPLTFIPFGMGPRNCIGNRFALIETKAIMFFLLRKFDLIPTSKSSFPMQIDPKGMSLTNKGGFWMGLNPRN